MTEKQFQQFLSEFVPAISRKSRDANLATWILETTGLEDAVRLRADLDTELKLFLSDSALYQRLLDWEQSSASWSEESARELNVLIRAVKQMQAPKEVLEKISQKEAEISQAYGNFRAMLQGKSVSENDLRECLKNEADSQKRKEAWSASKEIGPILAPHILELVELRNQAARSVGFSDYFQMQLELQEVDRDWLLKTFADLGRDSDAAYSALIDHIEKNLSERFSVSREQLGPWAWSDPFGQEDPLESASLDDLLRRIDIPTACAAFYHRMGIDVGPILQKSDMYEREGKSQHAFCINIDRGSDVRTLNNVRPNARWLDTVLHELGHAIYELGFDPKLPWLLREPPHMITTEAMALLAGRQAHRRDPLKTLLGASAEDENLLTSEEDSLKRRQLIFSRWVFVMTEFESELYRDPAQDLNRLWWSLVEKHQKIKAPKGREGRMDWACKYHIGLAPAYYYAYLLGEMFASSIQEALLAATRSTSLETSDAGRFLNQKLFSPGNRMSWDKLVEHVTGSALTADAWLREYAPH